MAPEIAVGLVLSDPEFVHVGQQVEFAEGREEGADAGSGVGENGFAVWLSGGGVRAGEGVVLTDEGELV